MNGYSLVIDISSDEGMTSTPIKSVSVNMVGKLNISDSSLEAWRSSDAELDSTFETDCDVKKTEPTPKKKKLAKVSFNLPPARGSISDSDSYYEEPDSPICQTSSLKHTIPLKEKFNIPQLGNERAPETAKPENKNEPSVMELEARYNLDIEDRNYFTAVGRGRYAPRVVSLPKENRCPDSPLNDLNGKSKPPEFSPEEMQYLEKMVLDLEEEEKKIEYMKAGRGRGPHPVRKYISRPSIVVKKGIPHCHGLPLSLASRGALSRPAPGRNFTCCSEIPGFGRGHGQGHSKYF